MKDPEIFNLVSNGFARVTKSGFDGFVGDAVHIFADWSEYPAALQCPLHYVIGDQDQICPLDWAQSFAQKYGHITVEEIKNAGQLLHMTHSDHILNIIEEIQQKD